MRHDKRNLGGKSRKAIMILLNVGRAKRESSNFVETKKKIEEKEREREREKEGEGENE
jgi:hypothetical protein